eukprot:3934247-Rhodomonas_salina.1
MATHQRLGRREQVFEGEQIKRANKKRKKKKKKGRHNMPAREGRTCPSNLTFSLISLASSLSLQHIPGEKRSHSRRVCAVL